MYQPPEQLIILNKANLETSVRFAGIALEGAERMIEAQAKAVKRAFDEGVHQAKVLIKAKDFEEITQNTHLFAQPDLGKTSSYIRSVCDVAAATQSEIGALLEQHLIELNKHYLAYHDKIVNWVPLGAEVAGTAANLAMSTVNSASDKLSKSGKQYVDTTPAKAESETTPAASGGKKKSA